MLFAIRLTLIFIWCYLLLITHVFIVFSEKKHRFFHHQFQKQLDSNNNKPNSLFHRQFDNHQEQFYDNDPCTRTPCGISNECIRLQHRHNHTKFRHRCMCLEQPCRYGIKNRKIQMK